MGLRADSARPQRVSGSARTESRRAESARNPIAAHVNFGDDTALNAFTRTQWTAAFTRKCMHDMNQTEAEYPRHSKRSQTASMKQCPFRRPTFWYLICCSTCLGSRDNSKYHTQPPTFPPTYIGESAHITHSAQSRTNVRKSLIVCNMTWRETSCGYHRIPSTAPPWPDTIMTPYHKFRSSCSAFVNLYLLLHPVNMPPCKLHGLALSYFSWVTKWSMLEPCTVRWK